MNGINEILILTGQAAVYYETFQLFGYSAAELRRWIPLPAHQPWFHLQSMHSIDEIPQLLLDAQTRLARDVVAHIRSLGITPVFPGYFGMVPPGFAERNQGATTTAQGDYGGTYPRVDQLDPTDEKFALVADAFYTIQRELFGDTSMFDINIVHEGGNPGTTPIAQQAQAIEAALQHAHPGATWVTLGWWHNPLRVMLDAIDTRHVLVLDGMADISRIDPNNELGGAAYAFGSIWNYGGRTHMTARLTAWTQQFHAWRTQPGSSLSGIAVLPEANDTHPAAFTLMTDLAWHADRIELTEWLEKFATYRYGVDDVHARAAWRVLGDTVYSLEVPPVGPLPLEPSDAFVAPPDLARPQLVLNPMRYDGRFDAALRELLLVCEPARHTSAYRYDLLDVARQALSYHAYQLHADMSAAYQTGEVDQLERLGDRWLYWMKLADSLEATSPQTLLGRYLRNAERWGSTEEERAQFRHDALALVTIWATRPGLDDYAGRGWSGLTGGYYHDRWQAYLQELRDAMKEGRPPTGIDWHSWGERWVREKRTLRTEAAGDVVEIAGHILQEIDP